MTGLPTIRVNAPKDWTQLLKDSLSIKSMQSFPTEDYSKLVIAGDLEGQRIDLYLLPDNLETRSHSNTRLAKELFSSTYLANL